MGESRQKQAHRKPWLGGYVRHGKKRPTFVIEKWMGGTHFHVSTRCATERAALKELERFEADPVGYRPGGSTSRTRLVITTELVLEYQRFMLDVKKNTKEWSSSCAGYLADWSEDLAGMDLRTVKLHAHLEPALDERRTCRRHRIEAIKAFCKWLRRKKGLLEAKDDPTVDLVVPQADPAQYARRKAVEEKRINAVIQHLPEDTRDVLLLLMATGMHISEVRRFATGGELVPGKRGQATLIFRHKSKRLVPILLRAKEYVQAAARIKARGRISANHTLNLDMTRACEMAGVERFTLGVMRHSFATNAVKRGASIPQVGDALHHATPATTKRYYVDMAVAPASVPTLRVLSGGRR